MRVFLGLGLAHAACSGQFAELDLTYAPSTGKFAGSITTNLCPPAHSRFAEMNSDDCVKQAFPEPSFSFPGPIPLLGRAALTLTGANIYSPYEAGFGTSTSEPPPFPCEDLDKDGDQDGYCIGGVDVKTCEDGLHYTCGKEATAGDYFLDECGGHAMPYHQHGDPACDYDHQAEGHSPLVAVALDGYGMYGLWEDGPGSPPTLDACNGHVGLVPASNVSNASTVYHYHFTEERPFTIGCFGPVNSLEDCHSLYATCNDAFVSVPSDTSGSMLTYDLWCPCYQHEGSGYSGFGAAAAAAGKAPVGVAVQGVNDGTAASRAHASPAEAKGQMEPTLEGESDAYTCPASGGVSGGAVAGIIIGVLVAGGLGTALFLKKRRAKAGRGEDLNAPDSGEEQEAQEEWPDDEEKRNGETRS